MSLGTGVAGRRTLEGPADLQTGLTISEKPTRLLTGLHEFGATAAKPAVLKAGTERLTGLRVSRMTGEKPDKLLTGPRVSWRFVNEMIDPQTGLRVSGGS